MAIPNPFRRHTVNTRTCWGYTFDLTDEHLKPGEAEPLKKSYDVLGAECLGVLDKLSPIRNVLPRNNSVPVRPDSDGNTQMPPRDLYVLFKDHHDEHPKLKELWKEVNTIPEWVDWEQIARGQDVFYRYGGACFIGLAYQSLLGGMGAARVVETLARTGGFSTKAARRRLFETTQHILQCTRSLESIQPGGDGFASTLRVRFLHAAVRNRILKLADQRPEYYNVKEWGIPINDLDSIATIGTFSSTLVWISLPRQGIFLRQQEILDYIALWRYVAYLVGCPTESFATPSRARAMAESLLYYEINPSEMSKVLANNIIKALDDQPPGYASADMLIASARWLNGNELGDKLGLPRPSLYYWALMAGQCFFFMCICYTYRSVAVLDRKKVAALKKIFYNIIVESKYGLAGTETVFDFKYIPEYSTITDMSDSNDVKPRMRGIEARNLRYLLLGTTVAVGASWLGLRIASVVASGLLNWVRLLVRN